MPIEQPHKKFQPVYLAYVARKLKDGLSKVEIIRRLEAKGANRYTTKR